MSHPKYAHIGAAKDKLIEEIGEVLQAIGKFERFGPYSFHPDRPEKNNLRELIDELNDLDTAISNYEQELYRMPSAEPTKGES